MLEIERQNNESDGGQSNIAAGSGDTAGSQGPPQAGSGQPEEAGAEARSPRRRRSVTRPPGPPSPEVIEPAAPASAGSPAGTAPESPAGPAAASGNEAEPAATTPRRRLSRSKAANSAVPESNADMASDAASDAASGADAPGQEGGAGEPARPATRRSRSARRAEQPAPAAADSDAGTDGSAGEPGAANARGAEAPAFQPPLAIFQPPDLSSARAAVVSRTRPAVAAPEQDEEDEETAEADSRDEAGQGTAASRRRRRGGRGRGKAHVPGDGSELVAGAAADDEDADAAADSRDGDDEAGGSLTGKRRRRRRRTASGGDGDSGPGGAPDDPPNTVVHVRPPREKSADVSDVKAIKGSTRLEAKRQRRREGRESGRRRPPIITESEFLARREAVERVMVVRQHGDRTQIAVMEDGVLVEHYVDKASHQSYVGNVYLGKVQNVLPSMEAAFVDIGKGRNAVLYAGEVNFDASGLEGESKRIESALKSGQSILVQVTKDPIGHKGARLTSQVSLPGRYLVYVPGASMTGISRKLPDTERTRLKQILKQVMPEHAGVIVRTAAEGASEDELARDVARLSAQWEAIEKKARTATAPDLLYSEPDLTLRVVRDIFNEDFGNLIIASDSEWDLVDEYIRYVAPHLSDRMERWEGEKDVFASYRIDEQLAKALERKVWLPSGGSLVIDHTEAMTVIDVNTGKFTGQGGNLEQTVTRNNLEAAEEIVRQLRLRDVGGIIVIDFIDMVLESNRELVLRRLLECLARDRTKHQVAEVTSLGLVQMTRKRVGSGLLEAFSVLCEHCNGRGVITSMEPVDHTPARGRGDDGHGHDSPPKPGPGRSRNGARGSGAARQSGGNAETGSDAGQAEAAADVPANSTSGGTEAPAAEPKTTGRSRSSRSRSRSGGAGQNGAGQNGAGDSGSGHEAAGQDAAGSGTEGAAPDGEPVVASSGRSRSGRRRAGSGGGQELESANS
jgi:ribonuclease E